MNTFNEITDFLGTKKLAIAGASRNPKKFGGIVLAELKKKGYEIHPVHPEATEIDGIPCVRSLDDLPSGIDRLYIVTSPDQTTGIVQQAVKRGISKIWIQQKSETKEALEIAQTHNIPVISGRCIMMFLEPVGGFHGFHRWLTRLFGGYPK
jgi:predicted CoA-binding protein